MRTVRVLALAIGILLVVTLCASCSPGDALSGAAQPTAGEAAVGGSGGANADGAEVTAAEQSDDREGGESAGRGDESPDDQSGNTQPQNNGSAAETQSPAQQSPTGAPYAAPEITPDGASGNPADDTPDDTQDDTPGNTPDITSEITPIPTPTPTPTPTPEPAAPTSAPAQQPGNEPIVLTIRGDGAVGETSWTLSMLQSMSDGYREYKYSTTNNWPNFGYASANGISVPYLLRQAGVTDDAAAFILTAADGYYTAVTREQMFGVRYAYANHDRNGSSGESAVEPVIAWEWGEDGVARPEKLRFFIGQRGPMEVNTSAFIRDIVSIEAVTTSRGSWDAPGASVADGSEVPFGTEMSLLHDNMDIVRIYYTLDGTEPDYNSAVYNPSTSFFQPHLITPIFLAGDVTIKALAAGIGRDPSPVVTFSYTVGEPE